MLKINELARLHLGVKGENLSRTIEIDMSAWAQTYPNATAEILHKRHGDQTKALTGATYDSETMLLSWTPTDYDTYYEGYGVAEIRMVEGEVVKKTKDLIVTAVCPSVIDGSGSVVASDYQAFLNSVIGYKNGAAAAKNAAEAAAEAAEAAVIHGPYIDDDTGNWFLWDEEEEAYYNTGIHAQGPPGSIDNASAETIPMSLQDPTTTIKDAMDEKLDEDQGSANAGKFMKVGSDGKLTPDNVPDPTGKADKVSGATSGNFAGLDENGNLTDSGHKHSDYLTSHQDISGKADKVSGATNGNFAGLDSNGNLTDSGHKHSDYLTSHQDISGKADKVSSATSGNFAGLDENGNLTDSGHKHSDYLTQHQDISGKVNVYQGTGNAGKALGIGNDGNVVPVPFSGDDFTGATASTAGVHGYVPAPAAGDQDKVLTGGGTWEISPGVKLLTVTLDTITNVSGSYTGTTTDARISSDMKPTRIFYGDPSVIRAKPTVTCNNGSITFACSDVVGTTTATVYVIKVIDDPTAVTSSEFDLLNNRIGDLTSLTTTAKNSAVAAINELDSDVSTLNSNISDLKNTIDDPVTGLGNKAPVIIDSASGSIASFSDGADDLPVKELKVAIEPVQDLHGYENPWPAGGGKNLLPMTVEGIKALNILGYSWDGNACTRNSVVFTILTDNDGNVTGINVNGTASAETYFNISADAPAVLNTGYTLNGCPAGGNASTGYCLARSGMSYDIGSGSTKTFDTAPADNNCYIRLANGASVSNKVFYPMIRLSSVADATFKPYSNICPISGWTEAKVSVAKHNLWDEECRYGYYDGTTGKFYEYSEQIANKNPIPVKPGMTIYPYVGKSDYTNGIRIVYLDKNLDVISVVNYATAAKTIPSNCYYVNFNLYASYGTTYLNDISINYPSTETGYHAYSGNEYSITFPSEAGTVYGGTLTVNADGTGTLVVDRVTIDADIYTSWVHAAVGGNEDRFDRSFSFLGWPFPKAQSNETCSHLKRVNTLSNPFGGFIISSAGQSRFLVFHNNDHHFANVEALNDYLAEEKAKGTPVQISYDIATPVIYTLTVPQVRTLLGLNHIWANTGDILSVDYPADTKLYIDGKIASMQALILENISNI